MIPLLVSMTTTNSYEPGDFVILLRCVLYTCSQITADVSEGKCTVHVTSLCCVSSFQGCVGGLSNDKAPWGCPLTFMSSADAFFFFGHFEEISW